MLKGIDPLLTPELLKLLAEMGHDDAIVLADANFTAMSLGAGKPVLRLPGAGMVAHHAGRRQRVAFGVGCGASRGLHARLWQGGRAIVQRFSVTTLACLAQEGLLEGQAQAA